MHDIIYDQIERVKNGKILKITIQQVTPEFVEPVIDHMVDHFIERESLCSHLNVINDAVSVESFRAMWRLALQDGAGIVALLNDSESGDPKIIGANVTLISKKSDPPPEEFPGESFQIALAAVVQITDEANVFEKYGVESYLTAYGLSVHRDYHGIGLGEAILRIREKVCEKFNLSLTETVFTGATSQYLAEKVGFELVLEYPYSDFNLTKSNAYRDLNGKLSVMVKRYKK